VNENVIADSFSVIPTCSESLFQPLLIRRGEKERFWTSQNDKDGYFQVKLYEMVMLKEEIRKTKKQNQPACAKGRHACHKKGKLCISLIRVSD
jgi:hypothetical protein